MLPFAGGVLDHSLLVTCDSGELGCRSGTPASGPGDPSVRVGVCVGVGECVGVGVGVCVGVGECVGVGVGVCVGVGECVGVGVGVRVRVDLDV